MYSKKSKFIKVIRRKLGGSITFRCNSPLIIFYLSDIMIANTLLSNFRFRLIGVPQKILSLLDFFNLKSNYLSNHKMLNFKNVKFKLSASSTLMARQFFKTFSPSLQTFGFLQQSNGKLESQLVIIAAIL